MDFPEEHPLPAPRIARRIRVRAGLSQGQLARTIGVARTTLMHWENGRAQPSELLRDRYARVLDELQRGVSA